MLKFFSILAACLILVGCSSIPRNSEKMHTDIYDQNWQPEHWLADGSTPEEVIEGFYHAGILTDQDMDDTIPVLEVGDAFLALSGQDQRRIVEFIDHIYGFTAANDDAVIYIEHDKYKGQIGRYTKSGLNMI